MGLYLNGTTFQVFVNGLPLANQHYNGYVVAPASANATAWGFSKNDIVGFAVFDTLLFDDAPTTTAPPVAADVQALDYDAFGNLIAVNGGNPTAAAALPRFLFTGQEFSAGLGLYDYDARFYDPATGRFLQQDPLGTLSGDGNNLSAYARWNPLNRNDPTGLASVTGNNAGMAGGGFAVPNVSTYRLRMPAFDNATLYSNPLKLPRLVPPSRIPLGRDFSGRLVSSGPVMGGGQPLVLRPLVHSNSAASTRTAYLYAKYAADGTFRKWGITQNLMKR